MITVDFSKVLKGPDGKVIESPTSDGKVEKMTLLLACTEALCCGYKSEENISGAEKYKRSKLATRINKEETAVNLSSEEVVMLKELIGKRWTALVIGPAWDAIEPPVEDELAEKRDKKKK